MNTQHPRLPSTSSTLAALLTLLSAACISPERVNPVTGDVGVDAPPPDTVAGDSTTPPDGTSVPDGTVDTGPDTGPPDVAEDTVEDTGSCADCPESTNPCTTWECNPSSGQCEEVDVPDGTDCSQPCSPGTCQAGACQGAFTTEPAQPGSCTGQGTCASSNCGTYECNLDTCMCELDESIDDEGCCINGGCDHLSAPSGCFGGGSCNPFTNTCEPDGAFDPSQCQCETPQHCGPPPDGCSSWTCSPGLGCQLQVQSNCTPCDAADEAFCDAVAKQQGGCFTGTCGPEGICLVQETPGCTSCQGVDDCTDASLCNPVECNDGVCDYSPVPDCYECSAPADCPESPDPCSIYLCPAGTCELTPLGGTNCNPDDKCQTDADCEDGDPCTQDSCTVSTGACNAVTIVGCVSLGCNGDNVDSPFDLINLPVGSPGKIAGEPIVGSYITSQQVTTCGDQDTTLYGGNIAIDDQGEVLDTLDDDGNAWFCQEQCNSMWCMEPHAGVRYWVWGSTDAMGALSVAGWCLEMEVASLVGTYEFQVTDALGDDVHSETTAFGNAGGELAISVSNPFSITNIMLSPLSGTLSFQMQTPQGGGPVVLTGDGNTLTGTLSIPGQDDYQVAFNRLSP